MIYKYIFHIQDIYIYIYIYICCCSWAQRTWKLEWDNMTLFPKQPPLADLQSSRQHRPKGCSGHKGYGSIMIKNMIWKWHINNAQYIATQFEYTSKLKQMSIAWLWICLSVWFVRSVVSCAVKLSQLEQIMYREFTDRIEYTVKLL